MNLKFHVVATDALVMMNHERGAGISNVAKDCSDELKPLAKIL